LNGLEYRTSPCGDDKQKYLLLIQHHALQNYKKKTPLDYIIPINNFPEISGLYNLETSFTSFTHFALFYII